VGPSPHPGGRHEAILLVDGCMSQNALREIVHTNWRSAPRCRTHVNRGSQCPNPGRHLYHFVAPPIRKVGLILRQTTASGSAWVPGDRGLIHQVQLLPTKAEHTTYQIAYLASPPPPSGATPSSTSPVLQTVRRHGAAARAEGRQHGSENSHESAESVLGLTHRPQNDSFLGTHRKLGLRRSRHRRHQQTSRGSRLCCKC